MSLAGKVALVTGASKGIGRAAALRLARDGASVVVNYISDASGAREVVEEIGSDKALAIQADAGNVAAITDMVERTVAKFGKIDILLACAGIATLSPLESTSEELFDKMFGLNVKGPYFLCQVCIALFRLEFCLVIAHGVFQKAAAHMPSGSHIVLISTTLVASSTVMPAYLPYLATKGAIEQMTRVMSKDLGRKGICVNCVAPGPTSTKLFLNNQTEQTLKFLGGLNPNGRIGEPEEVADAIALLCGHDSRWIMGQTLRVNGGMA
ncbi:hypothetical protein MMC22_010874 [Lobaria immixta]|nr:hypothetical protein [Lobaria immixta]